jgi:hypothetical protein
MPEDLQDMTLKTAALIRLVDVFDYSRMESRLGDVKIGEKIVTFKIIGPDAAIDAERMAKNKFLYYSYLEEKED